MGASIEALAQLAADANEATFSASSEPYEFTGGDGPRLQRQIIETSGTRGTRSRPNSRVRYGSDDVSGQLVLPVDPTMLDNWLPRILGGSEATDDFTVANTLPEFALLCDRVADIYQYDGCKVGQATFRGSEGQLLECALEIIAKTETGGKSFPDLDFPETEPYRFADGVLSVDSTEYAFNDFEIVINNSLTTRHRNSQSATDIFAVDRVVTFRCNMEWTSTIESALHDIALAGLEAVLTFTNGSDSVAFTLPALQVPVETPRVTGRGEIGFNFAGQARSSMDGATFVPEITVTNTDA